MLYLDKFYATLKWSVDLLEKATSEVYEAYKRETDVLKKSELRYLLRMLKMQTDITTVLYMVV